MGNPFSEGTGTPDGGNGTFDGNGTTGQNPAWNPFLEAVPQEYHEKVTPLLQEWDKGVNERFQKVHSEYEPYKPYKEAGVTPDTINIALSVLNTLQENPEYLWKSLGEYHKFGQEPQDTAGLPGQGQGEPEGQEVFHDPRYDELSQNYQKLAEFVLGQHEAQEAAQADAELDVELKNLRKQYGDYDEDYVVSKMLNQGMSGEEAVKSFKEMEQRLASRGPKPFTFLGGNSGGVPGSNTDIRKASAQDARNYAIQMLQAAAAERNQ